MSGSAMLSINTDLGIFTLPAVGRLGSRKLDRVFMESVNSRARKLRKVAGRDQEEIVPPLVALANEAKTTKVCSLRRGKMTRAAE